MSKINAKGAYTEAQNVPPVNPSTAEKFTREVDFMTDPRFEPSDYSFLGNRHDGYDPADVDGYFREGRESYTRSWSEKLVNNYQGLPLSPFFRYMASSLSNYMEGNSYQVVIKDVTEYPSVTTLMYSEKPLFISTSKYRIPIKESLKLQSYSDLYVYNPQISSQADDDFTQVNLYFDINQKSLTDVLTEEEEEMLSESKVGFESALTNEDYYIDNIWNDALLYDKHLTMYLYGSPFDWSTTPYLVPTSPNEALPNLVDIRFLSYVNRKRDFPETGEVGDVIVYRNDDYQNPEQSYYAWDPINEKWSQQVFDLFIEPTYVRQRVLIDSKIKNHKDLCLTLTPFTLVANYLPSFRIKKDLI